MSVSIFVYYNPIEF